MYAQEDIPSKVLSHNFASAKSFFAEIILHNTTRNGSLTIHIIIVIITKNHREELSRTFNAFSANYGNILLLGDFKACVDDETMKFFFS